MADETVPVIDHNPTVPGQPQAAAPMKTSKPLLIGACVVVGVIGIANVGNLASGHAKNQPAKSNLPSKPVVSDSNQVTSFQAAQARQAQHDQAELLRQQELAAQMAILQQQQETPGPESPNAPAMTPAQRQAMYGANNPNAPQRTSGATEAAGTGEAKGACAGTAAPAGSLERHRRHRLLQLRGTRHHAGEGKRGTRGECCRPGCGAG